MTVIAWDGEMLAADKRAVMGGSAYPVTKIHRVDRDRLAGIAGNLSRGQIIVEWLRAGAAVADYPKQDGDDDWTGVMVVHRDGRIDKYETRGVPFRIDHPFYAIGTGRDFATAAMALGKTAREAVELACIYGADCGNGVDVLRFEEGA